jgi:hypothetical protein
VTEGDRVADSGALRVRRARAHAAGDHSLCKRCAAVRVDAPPRLTALPPVPRDASAAEVDAALEMRRLALRLVTAHESEPANTLLARELRMTLAELMPKGKQDADADLTGLFSALQA